MACCWVLEEEANSTSGGFHRDGIKALFEYFGYSLQALLVNNCIVECLFDVKCHFLKAPAEGIIVAAASVVVIITISSFIIGRIGSIILVLFGHCFALALPVVYK